MASIKKVFVPLGHKGVILTCVAFGSPTPRIEWLKNGQIMNMTSNVENPGESVFVIARLVMHGYEFTQSDGGSYSCVAQAGSNTTAMSKDILLKPKLNHNNYPPVYCSFRKDSSDSLYYFQLHLHVPSACSIAEKIKEMKNVLRSVIVSECQNCSTLSEIMILNTTCSKKAMLVNGRINITNISERKKILCALNNWKNSGPLIQINGSFYLVDHLYPIISDENILKKQGLPNARDMGIADGIFLLVSVALSTVLLFQSTQLKRKKR